MKRLLLAVTMFVVMLLSPMFSSDQFTARAGHSVVTGAFCVCGCPDCLCDPGEQIEMCIPGRSETQQSDLPSGVIVMVAAGLVFGFRRRTNRRA